MRICDQDCEGCINKICAHIIDAVYHKTVDDDISPNEKLVMDRHNKIQEIHSFDFTRFNKDTLNKIYTLMTEKKHYDSKWSVPIKVDEKDKP